MNEIFRNAMEVGSVKARPSCGCPWSSTPWQDCLLSHLPKHVLLTKWKHLEHEVYSYQMQLELTQPLNTGFDSFLLTVLPAILTPVASCNCLLSVLNVAILSESEREKVRERKVWEKTICRGVEGRPWTTSSLFSLHRTHIQSTPSSPLHSTEINL